MAKSKSKSPSKSKAKAAAARRYGRLRAHRRCARTAGAAARGRARPYRCRCLRLASGRPTSRAGQTRQPRRDVAAQGHRPRARRAGGKYRTFRQGPARQQRAVVGRARHGQIVAGEGVACRRQCRAGAPRQERAAQTHRNPPRGHREPARLDGASSAAQATASSYSATTCRSTPRIPPTNRSRRSWKAASRAGRTM